MKACAAGPGYAGLLTGASLAGDLRIREPRLDAIVARRMDAGRLRFATDSAEGARFGAVRFIAVRIPPVEDAFADLRLWQSLASDADLPA